MKELTQSSGSYSSSNDCAVSDSDSDSGWEDAPLDTPLEFDKRDSPWDVARGGESLLSQALEREGGKSPGQSIGEDAPTTHDKQGKQEEQMGKEEEDISRSKTIDKEMTKCSSVRFNSALHMDSEHVIESNDYNSTGW